MNIGNEIYKKLLADAGVTNYVTKKGTYPCIANSVIEPDTWGISDKTCIIYQVTPQNGGEEYKQIEYTVNCRAGDQLSAETLAGYVYNALNRKSSVGKAFFVCSIEPVIQPQDSTDNYNVPVTVIGKGVD